MSSNFEKACIFFEKTSFCFKTLSNKTEALTKSMNMCISAIATVNQLFKEVLILKLISLKNEVITGKSQFFVVGTFCTTHLICLNIGFQQGSFVWKCTWKKQYSSF